MIRFSLFRSLELSNSIIGRTTIAANTINNNTNRLFKPSAIDYHSTHSILNTRIKSTITAVNTQSLSSQSKYKSPRFNSNISTTAATASVSNTIPYYKFPFNSTDNSNNNSNPTVQSSDPTVLTVDSVTAAAISSNSINSAVNNIHGSLLGNIIKYTSIGFIAGTVGSMCGVGGSIVLVPTLLYFCSYSQKRAAASGIAVSSLTACAGSFAYAANGYIDYNAAAILCLSASVTIAIGARLASQMNARHLQWLLGIGLICIAPLILLKSNKSTADNNNNTTAATTAAITNAAAITVPTVNNSLDRISELTNILLTGIPSTNNNNIDSTGSIVSDLSRYLTFTAGGSAMGLINGLLGFGGGVTLVSTLNLTSNNYHQLPYAMISGTVLSSLILPSVVGTIQHYRLGHFNINTMRHLPLLAIGTIIGAIAGAELAIKLPESYLKTFLTLFLLGTGTRTLTKLIKP